MNTEIRRATAEDVPAVAALEQELVRGDAPGDPYLVRTLMRPEVEEQLRKVVDGDWGVCLVATHDGEVVGYLSGGWKDSPQWRPTKATEIHALYLKDGFRGQGTGTRLVDEFVRWSWDRGAEIVEVSAFASNPRAIEFSAKTGFRPTLVHLERPLGPPADAESDASAG